MSQNNVNQAPNYSNGQPPVANMPVMPARPIVKTKNKFLTFVCSLIPGAGQMYFGLYKKGVSILLLFVAVCVLASVLYMPSLTFLLPVIYFYSFFESVNRMNMPIEEVAFLKDDYILLGSSGGELRKNMLPRIFKRGNIWIGITVLIVGVYALVSTSASIINYYFYDSYIYHVMRMITRWMPAIIIPAACIVIGLRLIFATAKPDDTLADDALQETGKEEAE